MRFELLENFNAKRVRAEKKLLKCVELPFVNANAMPPLASWALFNVTVVVCAKPLGTSVNVRSETLDVRTCS